MNPGGIRADLTYASSRTARPPGDVTFEEAFTVQPFNNYLVSLDLTGPDIHALLTQQVTGANAGTAKKILQVSTGFTYTMTPSGPVDGAVALDGAPLDTTRDLPDRDEQLPRRRWGQLRRRSPRAPTSTSAAWTSTRSPTTCDGVAVHPGGADPDLGQQLAATTDGGV